MIDEYSVSPGEPKRNVFEIRFNCKDGIAKVEMVTAESNIAEKEEKGAERGNGRVFL